MLVCLTRQLRTPMRGLATLRVPNRIILPRRRAAKGAGGVLVAMLKAAGRLGKGLEGGLWDAPGRGG